MALQVSHAALHCVQLVDCLDEPSRGRVRATRYGAVRASVSAGFGQGSVEAVAGPTGGGTQRQRVQVVDGDPDQPAERLVGSP